MLATDDAPRTTVWRQYSEWPWTVWKVAATASLAALIIGQVWALAVGATGGFWYWALMAFYGYMGGLYFVVFAWLVATFIWVVMHAIRHVARRRSRVR